jgi:hypothetical protein
MLVEGTPLDVEGVEEPVDSEFVGEDPRPAALAEQALIDLRCCRARPLKELASLFSGEEGMGRFLDLYLYHSQYINIKNTPKWVLSRGLSGLSCGTRLGGIDRCSPSLRVIRIPYLPFFDMLAKGSPDESIGRKEKSSPEYLTCVPRAPVDPATRVPALADCRSFTRSLELLSYITALHAYLLSFIERTRPLTDLAPFDEQAELEFESKWQEGKVEGWEPESEGPAANGGAEGSSGSSEGIWCAACTSCAGSSPLFLCEGVIVLVS